MTCAVTGSITTEAGVVDDPPVQQEPELVGGEVHQAGAPERIGHGAHERQEQWERRPSQEPHLLRQVHAPVECRVYRQRVPDVQQRRRRAECRDEDETVIGVLEDRDRVAAARGGCPEHGQEVGRQGSTESTHPRPDTPTRRRGVTSGQVRSPRALRPDEGANGGDPAVAVADQPQLCGSYALGGTRAVSRQHGMRVAP